MSHLRIDLDTAAENFMMKKTIHCKDDDFDEGLWFMLTVRMGPRHLGINLELHLERLLG